MNKITLDSARGQLASAKSEYKSICAAYEELAEKQSGSSNINRILGRIKRSLYIDSLSLYENIQQIILKDIIKLVEIGLSEETENDAWYKFSYSLIESANNYKELSRCLKDLRPKGNISYVELITQIINSVEFYTGSNIKDTMNNKIFQSFLKKSKENESKTWFPSKRRISKRLKIEKKIDEYLESFRTRRNTMIHGEFLQTVDYEETKQTFSISYLLLKGLIQDMENHINKIIKDSKMSLT